VTASDATRMRQPAAITVSDRELRSNWSEKIDWSRCTPPERREYLNRLNQAPPQYALRRARPRH